MSEVEFDKPLKNDISIKIKSDGLPESGWLETTRYQKVEARRTREVLRVPVQVILSSPANEFKEG